MRESVAKVRTCLHKKIGTSRSETLSLQPSKRRGNDIIEIMAQSIAHLTLVVRNYDEALAFYTQKLGFQLLQDTPLPGNKRWLLVAPAHSSGAALLLAEADTPE